MAGRGARRSYRAGYLAVATPRAIQKVIGTKGLRIGFFADKPMVLRKEERANGTPKGVYYEPGLEEREADNTKELKHSLIYCR